MLTRQRLLWLSLVLVCSGGCRMVAGSAAPGYPSCDGQVLRPQDQVWMVDTRHLGPAWCGDPAGRDVRVCRYDLCQGWVASDTASFYALDDPGTLTCFYIHAARVDHAEIVPRGLTLYRKLLEGEPDAPPVRLVIWSWPAPKTIRPLEDFRRQAVRADTDACYLGRFLTGINPEVRVSLVGFSMGPRIIEGAMHLLGGGTIRGFTLAAEPGRKRVRARVVLWAPAVDCYWMWLGQPHGDALVQVDQMLVFHNQCDPVLARYPILDRCCPAEALGYVGIPQPERLGEGRSRVETRDLSCVIGKRHSFDRYVHSPYVMAHTRGWALWKTAGEP